MEPYTVVHRRTAQSAIRRDMKSNPSMRDSAIWTTGLLQTGANPILPRTPSEMAGFSYALMVSASKHSPPGIISAPNDLSKSLALVTIGMVSASHDDTLQRGERNQTDATDCVCHQSEYGLYNRIVRNRCHQLDYGRSATISVVA